MTVNTLLLVFYDSVLIAWIVWLYSSVKVSDARAFLCVETGRR